MLRNGSIFLPVIELLFCLLIANGRVERVFSQLRMIKNNRALVKILSRSAPRMPQAQGVEADKDTTFYLSESEEWIDHSH